MALIILVGDFNLKKEIEDILIKARLQQILNNQIPTHKMNNALD